MAFLRLKDVIEVTTVSKARIYQLIKEGRFPQQVRLGGNSVAWVDSEVQQWIDNLIQNRDSATENHQKLVLGAFDE